jgi:hypothetical protein
MQDELNRIAATGWQLVTVLPREGIAHALSIWEPDEEAEIRKKEALAEVIDRTRNLLAVEDFGALGGPQQFLDALREELKTGLRPWVAYSWCGGSHEYRFASSKKEALYLLTKYYKELVKAYGPEREEDVAADVDEWMIVDIDNREVYSLKADDVR